jgi:hypothetical protein
VVPVIVTPCVVESTIDVTRRTFAAVLVRKIFDLARPGSTRGQIILSRDFPDER